eukprot:1157948-Pelagomonas_calceolata.AAC.3
MSFMKVGKCRCKRRIFRDEDGITVVHSNWLTSWGARHPALAGSFKHLQGSGELAGNFYGLWTVTSLP